MSKRLGALGVAVLGWLAASARAELPVEKAVLAIAPQVPPPGHFVAPGQQRKPCLPQQNPLAQLVLVGQSASALQR